jgi:hypothetical protein
MSDKAKPCPICKEMPDETSSEEGWILFCCKFHAAAPSYSDAVNAWNISVASLASMVRIKELEAKLAEAAWLLTDAAVQLEEGKIKTRKNRAGMIWKWLEDNKEVTHE